MTQTDDLQQAIALIRGGDKQQAQKLLEGILKADPPNVQAWYWYAETFSSLQQRIRVLEACQRCNPGNPQVQKVLDALRIRQEATQQPVAVPVQPPAWVQAEPPSFAANTVRRGKPVLNQAGSQSLAGGQLETPVMKPAPTLPVTVTEEDILRRRRRARPFSLGRYIAWVIIVMLVLMVPTVFIVAQLIRPVDATPYRHASPYEYYLYVPKGYTGDQAWPVFVGIHGSGGSGLDCWNDWQPYAEKEGFILICPSLDEGGGWSFNNGMRKFFAILNDVNAHYKTEPKVFVAGFSAGGQFVQWLTFQYPRYIRGVAVLSAGNYFQPVTAARNIPFLVIMGDSDDPARVQGCQEWVGQMQQAGFTVDYQVLRGVGHQVTSQGRDLTMDLFNQVR
jgi:predicted esterase